MPKTATPSTNSQKGHDSNILLACYMIAFDHKTSSISQFARDHKLDRHNVKHWLTGKKPVPNNVKPLLLAFLNEELSTLEKLIGALENCRTSETISNTERNRKNLKKANVALTGVKESPL